MIREKEKNNKEGRLKKFEEESYREAVSSIHIISEKLRYLCFSQRLSKKVQLNSIFKNEQHVYFLLSLNL